MSATTFAGGAQFAVVAVLSAGGDTLAAITAGTLINLRYIPMSVASAPWMPKGMLMRWLISQTITDSGWAMSARSDGRFDPFFMVGAAVPQYVFFISGTGLGALFSMGIGDTSVFGTDVLFPAFFLAILLGGELRMDRTAITVAAAGGTIALLLTPVAPAGVPLIAASAAALLVFLMPGRKGDVPSRGDRDEPGIDKGQEP